MSIRKLIADIVYPEYKQALVNSANHSVKHLTEKLEERHHREEVEKQNEKLNKIIEEQNAEIINLINVSNLSDIDEFLTKNYREISKFAYKDKRKYTAYFNKRYKSWNYSVYPNEMIQPHKYVVCKFRESIGVLPGDKKQAILKIGQSVDNELKWVADEYTTGMIDFYHSPTESLVSENVDCVAEYEKIRTKEGLKTVKDLKKGDLVLSYDFDKKEFVYKPILNVWDKGELEVYRVKFLNGQHIDVTENHNMFMRNSKYGKGASTYEKTTLSSVELNGQSWEKKTPCILKAKYEALDDSEHDVEDFFILGHYLAEGYHNTKTGHIETSGHDVIDYILPMLDKKEIPYHLRYNNSGCPVVTINNCEFKDWLKTILMGCFKLGLPEKYLWLPEEKIEAILDGYFLGDGHYNTNCWGKTSKFYSTSSDLFAEQLQILLTNVGRPPYSYHQLDHQGAGNKPIWRIRDSDYSYHRTSYGYNGLSETSIGSIEKIGKIKCYDFEVKDTHLFFFANGVISHNCESHSFLVASIKPDNIGVAFGMCHGVGHAWNVFEYNGELWCMETNTVANFLNSGNTRAFKYSAQTGYKIHLIFTKDKTYEVDASTDFGVRVK
jgi:hypothetical protein